MMLEHLGETEAAAAVLAAIETWLAVAETRTADLGGTADTVAVGTRHRRRRELTVPAPAPAQHCPWTAPLARAGQCCGHRRATPAPGGLMSSDYTLAYGTHATPQDGRCAMEWVSYLAGEPHSDEPVCVSPVLRALCVALNDGLADEPRQRLRPYLTRTIGTAGRRPGSGARVDGDGLADPRLHAGMAAARPGWPS